MSGRLPEDFEQRPEDFVRPEDRRLPLSFGVQVFVRLFAWALLVIGLLLGAFWLLILLFS